MSDAHAVARDQLRAFIERIERLEEEKKTIADDIKDVYGEAKGTGFDTKVLRKLISIRKQDRDERAEQEAILDMYMIALGMVDEPAGYDEPRQSAPVQRQPAMALRADGGLSIVTKHEDIRTSDGSPSVSSSLTTREAEESVVSNPVANAGEEATSTTAAASDDPASRADEERERQHASTVGFTDDCRTGGKEQSDASAAPVGDAAAHALGIPDPRFDKATVATQGEAAEPTSDDGADHAAAANAGGDHVDGGALRANRDENGEGAASTLPSKPKHRLRPNCLDRSNCKSGSVDHCWSCKKAMAEKSGVAA